MEKKVIKNTKSMWELYRKLQKNLKYITEVQKRDVEEISEETFHNFHTWWQKDYELQIQETLQILNMIKYKNNHT